MRRLSGQAARLLVRLAHTLAHLAIGAAVLLAAVLAGATWRLAQGPVDLSWLTARLEAAVNTPDSPVRLRIGDTALAWEGFRLGVDRPLDLRLRHVSLADPQGRQRMAIPQAEVSLSLGALLRGRLQPRVAELDGARLVLRRAADGALSLDLGALGDTADSTARPLPAVLAELARPPTGDRGAMHDWLAQIRQVRIHDAAVTVLDWQLGATWTAPRADIDLTRHPAGGVSGTGVLTLALGDQQAQLQLTAELSAAASETRLTARLSPIAPAALARSTPRLAALAAVDAPVRLDAALQLGPQLQLRHARVTLQAGAGVVHIRGDALPIVSARLVADGTMDAMHIDVAQVGLRGHPGGPVSTLSATGDLRRSAGQIAAALALNLDSVAFADLPRLWPPGIGRHARAWITENISDGVARNGHVALALTANADLSDLVVTRAAGTLQGDGLTVHWLRPVPPLENGQAELHILDPDTLEITVQGARQQLRGGAAGLAVTGGSMRITGLTQSHQVGTIEAQIAGSLPNALALLREPRLELLAKHPMPLNDPAGQFTGSLALTVPLEAEVAMDDIQLHATAHLHGVHLRAVVAGQDLDEGALNLDASKNGMTLTGQARLAGIPSRLDVAMDFRAGPPSQVLERMSVSGRPDARQIAAAGLDATEWLSGSMPLQAVLTEQRDGTGRVALSADLTPAVLAVPALDWRKPSGQSATASAEVRLLHDRLVGIDAIDLRGEGLSAQGSAQFAGDRLSAVRLEHVAFGRNQLQGTVRLPERPGAGPIAIEVSGRQLDLAARLTRPRHPEPPPTVEPPKGPAWTLNARFDRVLMAFGQVVTPLQVAAENDGRVFRRLQVTGETGPKAPFDVRIVPDGRGRRLTATVVAAGTLLRALNWVRTMQDGRLSLTATYDDSHPAHPLSGTAELTDFKVREAAGLGKLLQAMTLYGLVDALRGPGLAFNRAILPFRLASGVLELSDARAFSSSLGLTAKGRIELDAERVAVDGTIVPAYFFNSLLGHVPLIGKLLSPEQGGGVFAARYTLRGKLDDPDVFVNPLSALTPGFLRGLFGLL